MIRSLLKKYGLYRLAFPPGHFASPIPNPEEVLNDKQLFDEDQVIADINLNESGQMDLFSQFGDILNNNIYNNSSGDTRYHFENGMLGPMDGLMLYSMIRYFNPKKIVEVGSGYSSAIMLDVNNNFRNNDMDLTFIEPYPDRLKSLLREEDFSAVTILEEKIQQVDLTIFDALEANDILFLDTSHIVKTGSDVNFWLFNILPRLKPGVIIHIHDIFWPFEYPKEWIRQQKCYTELYLIRAFLMNNKDYEIQLFNNYLQKRYPEIVEKQLPVLMNTQGGSIWLKKVN